MRPLDRGDTPLSGNIDKTVADYKDWRKSLIDTIGNYCSYCNMILNDSPQVEHVTPKNPQPGQPKGELLAWNNMLLACGPCNRAKDNQPNSPATHYMPDSSNTHLAFDYIVIDHPIKKKCKACILVPKTATNINIAKAQNTIDLCKLAALTVNPRATDLRWKYRFDAWNSANIIWRQEWDNWGHSKVSGFVALLVDAAKSKGFFSIWFDAFHDVPDIKIALINAFSGTDRNSFQAVIPYDPQPRNPHNPTDQI